MNILIFSHEFPPQTGGAGVVAKEYARLYAEAGHNVTVLTKSRKNLPKGLSLSGYSVVSVYSFPVLWFISYVSFNFSPFDLIILNDPPAIFFAGLFFDSRKLSKSVAFLHGSEPENIYSNPSWPKKIIKFRTLFTKALYGCKKVVAVSEFMKKKFVLSTSLFDLESRISVVHSPIDRGVFYPEGKDGKFKEGLGLPPNAKIALTVSRLVEGKGYYDKLMLMRKIVDIDPNWYWIIVGNGEYEKDFISQAKKNGMINNIIMVGKVPREELRFFYSNSDFFILLSNFCESFGLVYLEAQACGCPVIGRDRGGVKEALNVIGNGCLVNDESEVLGLVSDGFFNKPVSLPYLEKCLDKYNSAAIEFLAD